MNIPEHVEVIQDCAFFRPVGTVSLSEAVQLVTQVINFARARQLPRLFVNTNGLTGFPSPTLAERYFFAREWAAAARGCVRTVLVVPAHMIDPDKFGITVARNAGMDAEVFTTEPGALAWLAGEADGKPANHHFEARPGKATNPPELH
jgi:hypothetical protein